MGYYVVGNFFNKNNFEYLITTRKKALKREKLYFRAFFDGLGDRARTDGI
jgi:hypothetical protein